MSTPLDHPECLLSSMIVLGADGSFHGPNRATPCLDRMSAVGVKRKTEIAPLRTSTAHANLPHDS